MNRLILIGNGFDLAHNLKTSYKDFIIDYLSNAINTFREKQHSIDPLLEIRYKHAGYTFRDQAICTPENALHDFGLLQQHDYTNVNIKSRYFSNTLKRVSEINWVDLENDYFEQLLTCKGPQHFNSEKVKALNIEFDFLKTQLESYLIRHQEENEHAYSPEYTKLFCESIKRGDIVTIDCPDQLPKKICLLSFNYTNTLEKYKTACIMHTQLNYIHGELGSESNPIIFGFGDEYNKHYLEFEDLRDNELLKHIKSFGYFKTSNYHDLMRFIELDDFQVYIFGHSLGLSDRTMLKEIFEHKSCKSVKIFYHQKDENNNDYTEKTFDISAHFGDKGMMRKKIVPYNLSFPMPQVNN